MFEYEFTLLIFFLTTIVSCSNCDNGMIKYPIIWGTEFDDICYSKSSATMSYNTSYIDDVLVDNDVVYMATRFHHLRTTLTNDSVVPSYVFDLITNPILIKASIIIGKIDWAKRFMNSTEINDNIESLWIIYQVVHVDHIWILLSKEYDYVITKLLKVDKDNGSLLDSFQFQNKQKKFNLRIFNIIQIVSDEFLVLASGNKTANNIGISSDSKVDAILFKMNITSHSITQSTICDCQQGNEKVTSIEFEGDYIYSLGQKDNTYIFIK